MVESDYPHADSTWPDTQALLAERFAGLPDADVAKITHENAARLFRHPLPPEWVCRGLVGLSTLVWSGRLCEAGPRCQGVTAPNLRGRCRVPSRIATLRR